MNRDLPECTCGSDNPRSARFGHAHLVWCHVVGKFVPEPHVLFNRWFDSQEEARQAFFSGMYQENQLRVLAWLAFQAGRQSVDEGGRGAMTAKVLRYWVYRHGGIPVHDWRVLSQTNDEATARWLYENARARLRQGGVRLVDTEQSQVLEEAEAPTTPLGG